MEPRTFDEYLEQQEKSEERYGIFHMMDDTRKFIKQNYGAKIFLIAFLIFCITVLWRYVSMGSWIPVETTVNMWADERAAIEELSVIKFRWGDLLVQIISMAVATFYTVDVYKRMYRPFGEPTQNVFSDGLRGFLRTLGFSLLAVLVFLPFVMITSIMSFTILYILILIPFLAILIITGNALMQDVRRPFFETVGHGISLTFKKPGILGRLILASLIVFLTILCFTNIILLIPTTSPFHTVFILLSEYLTILISLLSGTYLAIAYAYYDDHLPSYALERPKKTLEEIPKVYEMVDSEEVLELPQDEE